MAPQGPGRGAELARAYRELSILTLRRRAHLLRAAQGGRMAPPQSSAAPAMLSRTASRTAKRSAALRTAPPAALPNAPQRCEPAPELNSSAIFFSFSYSSGSYHAESLN